MPYKVVKTTGGYKVGLQTGGKMSNGRYYLSNRPLTLKKAKEQMKAVQSAEKRKGT